jgi:hypothetical protein
VIGEPPFDAGGEKLTLACPSPPAAVPMVGAPGVEALIVMVIVLLVKLAGVGVLLSVTMTLKEKLPAAVGDPEITPLVLSDRPAGRAPLAGVVEKV